MAIQKEYYLAVRKVFCRLQRQSNFFKTPILFILRSKMNKIGVLKNIIWRRQPPNNIFSPPHSAARQTPSLKGWHPPTSQRNSPRQN
jgi:hypothetical protein